MEYKIVSASSVWSFDTRAKEMVKAVNEAIAQGWEPIGAPFSAEHTLNQAMIKRR